MDCWEDPYPSEEILEDFGGLAQAEEVRDRCRPGSGESGGSELSEDAVESCAGA